MKKIVFVLLLVFLLAACGDSEVTSEEANDVEQDHEVEETMNRSDDSSDENVEGDTEVQELLTTLHMDVYEEISTEVAKLEDLFMPLYNAETDNWSDLAEEAIVLYNLTEEKIEFVDELEDDFDLDVIMEVEEIGNLHFDMIYAAQEFAEIASEADENDLDAAYDKLVLFKEQSEHYSELLEPYNID